MKNTRIYLQYFNILSSPNNYVKAINIKLEDEDIIPKFYGRNNQVVNNQKVIKRN